MSATDYPCTVDDLLPYLPFSITISDTTVPSQASTEAIIVNVADEINGALRSRGFVIPLPADTPDSALSFLNTCCIYGALGRWGRSRFPSDNGPGGEKGFAKDYETKYQAHLQAIQNGAIGTPDVPRAHVTGSGFSKTKPIATRGMIF